jgi:hypothetical protein
MVKVRSSDAFIKQTATFKPNDDSEELLGTIGMLIAACRLKDESLRLQAVKFVEEFLRSRSLSGVAEQKFSSMLPAKFLGEFSLALNTDSLGLAKGKRGKTPVSTGTRHRDEDYLRAMFAELKVPPSDWPRLSELWRTGRDSSPRGLPKTTDFCSYRLHKTAGRRPDKISYDVDGRRKKIIPPLCLRILREDAVKNALFISFEEALLGFDSAKKPDAAYSRRLGKQEQAGLKARGINWTEGKLDGKNVSLTLPGISAAEARESLVESKQFSKKEVLLMPEIFWNADGRPSTFLRHLCDKILKDDGRKIGRRERFALARLLFIPVIRLERFIFDAASGHTPMRDAENTTLDALRLSESGGIEILGKTGNLPLLSGNSPTLSQRKVKPRRRP